MRHLQDYLVVIALACLAMLSACKEEEEPFEYPDSEITEPTNVTHFTRSIKEGEKWQASNFAEGCEEDLNDIDFAFYELLYSRGFATMHLKPDSTSCDLWVELKNELSADEVASDYWKNWKIELTFSELRLDPKAELRFRFGYREVELDLDLAPHMREVYQIDSNFTDANGVFSLNKDEGYSDFQLSGTRLSPDFSEGSGNMYNDNADVTEPYVEVYIASKGAEEQSLFIFNFIRVSSFGIPEEG